MDGRDGNMLKMIKAMCYICGKLIKEGDKATMVIFRYNQQDHQSEEHTLTFILDEHIWNEVITTASVRYHGTLKHESCKLPEIIK